MPAAEANYHKDSCSQLIVFILQSILARRFTNRINREDIKTLPPDDQVAARR